MGVNLVLTLPDDTEQAVVRRAGEAGIALQGFAAPADHAFRRAVDALLAMLETTGLAELSAMSPEQRRHMGVYERTLEKIARMPIGDWYMKKIAPRLDPPLLRLTGGRVSSVYPVPVMLLTTTGAKTGQPRTLPLLYIADGDHLILIASNYGKTSHPAWYRNLLTNPKAEVLAGSRSGMYTASEVTDATERDRAWDLALDMYAGYGDYEGRAGDRTIPLIRLDRVAR